MRKISLIGFVMLIVSIPTFAGGLLTNTNQHAAFLRMLSRGATFEIDGALSNPAAVKKFFNTSGLVYKELKLSEKLPAMSEEEQIALLATNGKLVKRPLVVTDSFVLVGFKPDEWEKLK